jgi:hypothetical protein
VFLNREGLRSGEARMEKTQDSTDFTRFLVDIHPDKFIHLNEYDINNFNENKIFFPTIRMSVLIDRKSKTFTGESQVLDSGPNRSKDSLVNISGSVLF